LRFAWVKGSEGAGGPGAYVDPAAREHLARLRTTPMLSGMYHFARPDNRFANNPNGTENGQAEGEHAARTAIDLGVAFAGSLPIAIDLEKYTPRQLGITDAQRDAFVLAMVDTLEAMTGRLPVIYTGAVFWSQQHTVEMAKQLRARGVPLWLVKYDRAVDPSTSIPGWPWSVWQHSGGGDFAFAPALPGLPSPIDQNIYRGTLAELRGLVQV
jgi:GH25 family lysozyme M1 (1,4-beta-N-acetylmuramidase)